MASSNLRLLSVLVSILSLVLAPPVTRGQDVVSIRGKVRDPDNNPIPETVISVFLDGEARPKRTESDENGEYSLQVPSGKKIIKIVYNHKKWHVRIVEELAGVAGDENVINKLLLDKEGPKSFDAIVDQIMVYDRLRIAEQYRDINPQTTADLDPLLKTSEAALRRQYGDRVLSIPHPFRANQDLSKGRLGNGVLGQPVDVLIRLPKMGDIQREVISNLTPIQRNVVNRLMGDLLFRYGYTSLPTHELLP